MYNEGRMLGVIIGIMVGIVIVMLVLRTINRDKKMKTDYDEMQKQIRGTGYKYAFYTVLIYEAMLLVVSMAVELPAEACVIHFSSIFLGVTVQVCYCIMKDAYIGLNTNVKRYVIIMGVVSLFNLWTAGMTWKNGEMIFDGKLQAPFINFLCGLMFVFIGAAAVVKYLADLKGENEA